MRQSIIIAIVVSMQLISQLLMQLLVIRLIGIGPQTDAYIAAQGVPTVLGAIIITALQSVWLPRMSVQLADNNDWRRMQAVAQGQAFILSGGVLLVLGSLVQYWLPQIYPGLDGQQQQDAILYSVLLIATAGFTTQTALLTVALRSRGRFVVSECVTLLGTVISLVAMFFALPLYGLAAAAWIALARAIAVYLAQLHLAGWPALSLTGGWRCKETWGLMRPLLLGTSIYKTSPVVDRYWASHASTGGMTLLNLAQTATVALATVLERAIGMPIVPSLSRLAAERKYAEIRKVYRVFLLRTGMAILLLALTVVLLEDIMVHLFSQIFSMTSAYASEFLLFFLLMFGHLFASVAGGVLVSVFYAFEDSRTPVFIGITGFFIGLVLKWIFFWKLSISGLAMATSIYFVLNIFMFIVALEKKISRLEKNEA